MVVVGGPTSNVYKLQTLMIQLTLYVLDTLNMEQKFIKKQVKGIQTMQMSQKVFLSFMSYFLHRNG